MNIKTILFLSTFALNACATNHNFSPAKSLTIDYMQTANAVADAQVAINNNDFTLIGFDRRGLVVPGVKQSNIKSIRQHCAVQRIKGMTDAAKSVEHLSRMRNVSTYSKAYNLEILNTSSCQE